MYRRVSEKKASNYSTILIKYSASDPEDMSYSTSLSVPDFIFSN